MLAAIDDAQIRVHAEAQAFERGREMPGIDQRAVHGGLAADRVEPRPVQKGLAQWMARQGLIEARDRGGGIGERTAIGGALSVALPGQSQQPIEGARLVHLRGRSIRRAGSRSSDRPARRSSDIADAAPGGECHGARPESADALSARHAGRSDRLIPFAPAARSSWRRPGTPHRRSGSRSRPPLFVRQRGDILEFGRDGADQHAKILAARRIGAVAGEGLEMKHRLGDRGFQRRRGVVDAEAAVAEAAIPSD